MELLVLLLIAVLVFIIPIVLTARHVALTAVKDAEAEIEAISTPEETRGRRGRVIG